METIKISQRLRNALAFASLSIVLGALAGSFTWAFFFLMARGINYLWHTLPQLLHVDGATLAFYPLVVCSLGGLAIGLFQKFAGPYPDDLNTVVATIKKEGSFPHNHIGRSFFGALLPLFFGGSVGPEAGLTGVIAGICSAIGERLHFASSRLKEVATSQTAAVISAIYGAPLFGFFGSVCGYTDNPKASSNTKDKVAFPRKQKMVTYFLAIASALAAIVLLGKVFGGGLAMPHFSTFSLSKSSLLASVPAMIIGAIFGWLFHGAGAFFSHLNKALKGAVIFKALCAGVVLGGIGCFLPYVMFAGEDQVETLNQIWPALGPWILLLTSVLKVVATQMCLNLGWRGGHFFPLIFAGIACGYGCSILFQADPTTIICATTAALMGAVMQKPLFTVFLLFLCFPAESAFIMLIAAALGAAIPVPKAWRE